MDVEFLRHAFEDREEGVIVKKKFKLGVRHLQAGYMLLCAATLGAVRGSTPVAALALADRSRRNDTYIQIQNWDGKVQGAIMSSFLFGYALTVLPAELLLRRVKAGGKQILTVVLIITGALAVAMPTIVKKGGWIALCNAQLWMGVAQAFLTPSNQALLNRFLLPSERNLFGYIVHAGTILGVMIGLPLSGIFSEARLGWELIFYSQAMLTLSIACMWGLLTARTPDKHEAMGDTEKEVIKEALSCCRKKIIKVPWRQILISRQFWATAAAHAASNAVFIFVLFNVPTFLMTYGLNLRVSSWQAALPWLGLVIRLTTAPMIDRLLRTLKLSFQVNLQYLRKVINAIGACGVVAGLTVLPNLTRSWHGLSILILIGIMASSSFQFCGFLDSYKDMSENYHGSLLALSRAIASCFGAFVPILVGVTLGDDFDDMKRWRVVFLSLASVYAVGNILYTGFGSSDRQYWDGGITVKDKFGYHNALIDTNQLELEELNHLKKQPLIETDDIITVNTAI